MGLFRILFRLFSGRRRSSWKPRHRTIWPRSGYEPVVKEDFSDTALQGRCWVVDGDTIVIDNRHIRLAGIDAPELDQPWGKQAKWALVKLCKGQIITARLRPELPYDRVVAECYLPDGRDLSAELVSCGLALDWPKFSGGKYRHLETPEARRNLWRADARQRGKFRPCV